MPNVSFYIFLHRQRNIDAATNLSKEPLVKKKEKRSE